MATGLAAQAKALASLAISHLAHCFWKSKKGFTTIVVNPSKLELTQNEKINLHNCSRYSSYLTYSHTRRTDLDKG